MKVFDETCTAYSEEGPHNPMTQLLALLLLATCDEGHAFSRLMPEAQRSLLVLAYEKALEASRNQRDST